MMGCNCGGGKPASLYNIMVTFKDGSTKVYKSKPEARIAIASAGGGGTMKQVLAKTNPVT